nr:PREDICTED: PDZ and LIM domain protein Zasp-like isoform X3 [Bemisia tabaci]
MATQRMIVNNQFNSPINLYSPENVDDTLKRQAHILTNGAIGIDFHTLPKPTNLANSAVLKMLQEENSQNRKGLKQVTWPPPPIETYYYPEQTPEVNTPSFQQSTDSSAHDRSANQRIVPQPTDFKKSSNFEQPPSTIQLRSSLPVRQAPSPVFSSQPATASIQGGARMRGDTKWPPEPYKQQAAAENALREAIAKGPACRPRKVQKDYTSFFAQHALNSTYPGYRAPPGTQHQHTDESNF